MFRHRRKKINYSQTHNTKRVHNNKIGDDVVGGWANHSTAAALVFKQICILSWFRAGAAEAGAGGGVDARSHKHARETLRRCSALADVRATSLSLSLRACSSDVWGPLGEGALYSTRGGDTTAAGRDEGERASHDAAMRTCLARLREGRGDHNLTRRRRSTALYVYSASGEKREWGRKGKGKGRGLANPTDANILQMGNL